MNRYKLELSSGFARSYRKLAKNNLALQQKLERVFQVLKVNPANPKLRTHKVQTKKFGQVFSSRVTGDIRLVWNFSSRNTLIIRVIDIGGHSGGKSVY